MSDTPRTDKAYQVWLKLCDLGRKVVADNAAEFASQLERELQEAQLERDHWKQRCTESDQECSEAYDWFNSLVDGLKKMLNLPLDAEIRSPVAVFEEIKQLKQRAEQEQKDKQHNAEVAQHLIETSELALLQIRAATDGALDESPLNEAVAILISQRDNARIHVDHWSLRATIAEADTKRLDWLDGINGQVQVNPEWSIKVTVDVITNGDYLNSYNGVTIRQAIDAAMKGTT